LRFGKLVALKPHHERGPDNRIRWLCACDCGGQIITEAARLKNNNTRSCGCLKGSNQYAPNNVPTTTAITPSPIGLTDRQLDALLDAAHGIEVEWRARFLALVADELLPLEQITTVAVEQACTRVRGRMVARGHKGHEQQQLRRA
jgi:hypothetical protein